MKTDWVILGGGPGEAAHCTRCGKGLQSAFPIDASVFIAASKAFTKLHRTCKPVHKEPIPQTLNDWIVGRDTGISSKSIYAAATGATPDQWGVPHDPDDFGRCYRLVKLFPFVKESFRHLVMRCPKWGPFVKNWDELVGLYEKELPTGKCPLLYARIQELEGRK